MMIIAMEKDEPLPVGVPLYLEKRHETIGLHSDPFVKAKSDT